MDLVPRLGSGIPLFARERELDQLRAAFERADNGDAAAILLAGDAGVGKSRLLGELAEWAQARGALVLTGRCLDIGETGLPYLPFAEALSRIGGDDLTAVRSRPALGRLLPSLELPRLADRVPQQPPALAEMRAVPQRDVGQLQLFDAVLGLLGELAERRPVLLVVEDLHWADPSTRDLLSFLLSRLHEQRILVVASYRSDDLHRSHPLRPLLAELVRMPVLQRLDLAPFSPTQARGFVTALAEDQLPDDVVADIAKRSDGNPFFAEELLAAYAECDQAGMPPALADVLLARVESLPARTRKVIRLAS
ncbi:MAG: AAA family ATPase, partial [Sciscionella sp.]|nr:AAA family ATPase [Sciscionella sp.]